MIDRSESLADILARLEIAARLNPGSKNIRTLKNGLRIEFLFQAGTLKIQLIRKGSIPSTQEWDTVMKAMNVSQEVKPTGYAVGRITREK